MKHLFIFNPNSLPQGKTRENLLSRIRETCKDLDYEIYFSSSQKDAQDYAANACAAGEEICVYAGGGDGTIRQIAEAILPFPNAVLSAVPVGTGNDFIRNFGGKKKFLELDYIQDGEETTVDVMKANDYICVNMINIGFDESVVRRVNSLRHFPLMSKSIAYTIGVVFQLLQFPKENLHITSEQTQLYNGECLLTFIANGKYCGGGYKSASEAKLDDGLLDHMIVHSVSRRKFLSLVGSYKNGTLIPQHKADDITSFSQLPAVRLQKDTPFYACFDGDIFTFTDLTVEVIPHAIRFRYPKGAFIE